MKLGKYYCSKCEGPVTWDKVRNEWKCKKCGYVKAKFRFESEVNYGKQKTRNGNRGKYEKQQSV